MRTFALALFFAATLSGFGQGVPSPGEMAQGAPPPPPPDSSSETPARSAPATPSAGSDQATIDRLTQTNQELLDLLKKQQAVLEDIQYDRRLQNRQIQLIEVRLEDTLQLNASLQAKIAGLEASAAAAAANPSEHLTAAPEAPVKPAAPEAIAPTEPPPPASYLPAPETEGTLGTMSWHRLFTDSGDDAKTSDIFHIQGKQWRVLWHNQDKAGAVYKNTSALFISAFPKGDSIPKKVCSKLGTGGDSTELVGSGDYYLKIEASGGNWEIAVEDFR